MFFAAEVKMTAVKTGFFFKRQNICKDFSFLDSESTHGGVENLSPREERDRTQP